MVADALSFERCVRRAFVSSETVWCPSMVMCKPRFDGSG
jgi:hypothetical protein